MLDESFCASIPDSSFKTNLNLKTNMCKDQFDMEHILGYSTFRSFPRNSALHPLVAGTISCPTWGKEGEECELLAAWLAAAQLTPRLPGKAPAKDDQALLTCSLCSA